MRMFLLALCLAVAACGRLSEVGKAPAFSPVETGNEYFAMTSGGLPGAPVPSGPTAQASLWSGARASLLGDQRARQRGDILTVVVEINDKAEMTDTSGRSRTSSGAPRVPTGRVAVRVDHKRVTVVQGDQGSKPMLEADTRKRTVSPALPVPIVARMPNSSRPAPTEPLVPRVRFCHSTALAWALSENRTIVS